MFRNTILALLLVPVVMKANNDELEKIAREIPFKEFVEKAQEYANAAVGNNARAHFKAKRLLQAHALYGKNEKFKRMINSLKTDENAQDLILLTAELITNSTTQSIMVERINRDLHPDTVKKLHKNLQQTTNALVNIDGPEIIKNAIQSILSFIEKSYNFTDKDLPESPKHYRSYSPSTEKYVSIAWCADSGKNSMMSKRMSLASDLSRLELEESPKNAEQFSDSLLIPFNNMELP